MPDIILSPAERPCDYCLELGTTSTAQANGCDTNSATAQLSRFGQVLSGQLLCFTLSGEARFSHGGQQISVTTDCRGEATVFFTDTRQETVCVTCTFYQTQASGSAGFSGSPQASIGISGEVLRNGAVADGSDRNTMRYHVFSPSGEPVPGISLAFGNTGNAMLIPSSGFGETNDYGIFDLSLTNQTPQQVLVTAGVPADAGVENNTFLNFVPLPLYLLTYRIIRDNEPADNLSSNTIIFTLTRDGASAVGERLSFTANPPTATISAGDMTNIEGHLMVNVISPTAGPVEVTAAIDSQPRVPPIHAIVTFTALARRYFIANEVIRDREPADGSTPNQVRFTVLSLADGTPQSGIPLEFSVSGSARLSAYTGTTQPNGTFLLDVFNNIAATVRVTARVTTEPLTNSNVDVGFI